jgi:glutamine synthetase
MGKQEDFVLRALEERDVRFVRLWVHRRAGLPEVGRGRAGRARLRLPRGDRLRRSAIEGFARVYEADMLAKPDRRRSRSSRGAGETPSTARMFCDITMPDGSPS